MSRMRLISLVSLIVGVVLSHGIPLEAQPESVERGVIIDTVRRLPFRPVDSFFLVSFDESELYLRVPAVLADLSGGKSRTEGTLAVYAAGARVEPPPEARAVTYHAVFLGPEGRLEFVPAEKIVLNEDTLRAATPEALREALLQRKGELGSWRMQAQAQEESLKRLRSDAEIIGDFGRIIDKKEELEKTRTDTESVRRDIENLRRFLRLAKGRSAPVNQVGREAQLVGQLGELAKRSSAVEMGEVRRRAGAEAELQRKLALIEATRGDDLGGLVSELTRLRAALGETLPSGEDRP